MENVSLRQAINAKLQANGVGSTSVMNIQGEGFQDVWAMIFASLQGGVPSTLEQGANAMQNVEQMLPFMNTDDQDVTQEQLLAMEELAAALMAIAQFENPTVLAQGEDQAANLGQLVSGMSKQQLNKIYELFNQVKNSDNEQQQQNAENLFEKTVIEIFNNLKNVQSQQYVGVNQAKAMLYNFNQNMQTAQKLVKTNLQDDDMQGTLSIAQLQQIVDGQSTTSAENANLAQPKIDMQDMIDNLKQSLSTKTAGDEFSLKLKPEGMGEIIVKLVQTSDKGIQMNIIASNENVAKALSQDISQLQQALKPVNASVETIVAQTNGQSAYGAFDSNTNMFNQNSHQQRFSRNTKNALSSNTIVFGENSTVLNVANGNRLQTSLDTYI